MPENWTFWYYLTNNESHERQDKPSLLHYTLWASPFVIILPLCVCAFCFGEWCPTSSPGNCCCGNAAAAGFRRICGEGSVTRAYVLTRDTHNIFCVCPHSFHLSCTHTQTHTCVYFVWGNAPHIQNPFIISPFTLHTYVCVCSYTHTSCIALDPLSISQWLRTYIVTVATTRGGSCCCWSFRNPPLCLFGSVSLWVSVLGLNPDIPVCFFFVIDAVR